VVSVIGRGLGESYKGKGVRGRRKKGQTTLSDKTKPFTVVQDDRLKDR
jgi:hypothetical protein